MFKKILLGTVMSAALTVGIPVAASAATSANNATTLNAGVVSPQVRIRIGQPRRRWNRNGRWDNRRYEARTRVVPQYYWMNGRRYVRYVRVRNF